MVALVAVELRIVCRFSLGVPSSRLCSARAFCPVALTHLPLFRMFFARSIAQNLASALRYRAAFVFFFLFFVCRDAARHSWYVLPAVRGRRPRVFTVGVVSRRARAVDGGA